MTVIFWICEDTTGVHDQAIIKWNEILKSFNRYFELLSELDIKIKNKKEIDNTKYILIDKSQSQNAELSTLLKGYIDDVNNLRLQGDSIIEILENEIKIFESTKLFDKIERIFNKIGTNIKLLRNVDELKTHGPNILNNIQTLLYHSELKKSKTFKFSNEFEANCAIISLLTDIDVYLVYTEDGETDFQILQFKQGDVNSTNYDFNFIDIMSQFIKH